ncbi:MAG: DUF350 domain-containing protein [Thermoleophilaceae bacterium]|jgi:uncharacterized membrane protein YjfL (UPF0719 family)|nr:DUF350 domain-containing protein [Thermoleophilaceae bacterium]
MLELVAQILAYTGVGLVILVVGFFALDLITPGNLGKQVIEGNPNAALLSAATLASLGVVLWFAIFATDAGWAGLDETAVFGLVSVAAQAVCFLVLDLITPGKLGEELMSGGSGAGARIHPGTWVSASAQVAIALVIAASLI